MSSYAAGDYNDNLKSNMDRFIVADTLHAVLQEADLKSNMDRFIAMFSVISLSLFQYLKSNMDRFIVVAGSVINLSNPI